MIDQWGDPKQNGFHRVLEDIKKRGKKPSRIRKGNMMRRLK
jgi:hypothetical protein